MRQTWSHPCCLLTQLLKIPAAVWIFSCRCLRCRCIRRRCESHRTTLSSHRKPVWIGRRPKSNARRLSRCNLVCHFFSVFAGVVICCPTAPPPPLRLTGMTCAAPSARSERACASSSFSFLNPLPPTLPPPRRPSNAARALPNGVLFFEIIGSHRVKSHGD